MSDEQVLVDSFGRKISSLRVSVTDRCNFHCVYCMPEETISLRDRSSYLNVEEIVRFVRMMGKFGVTRVRLTGGEPLLREDIVEIVRRLKTVPTVHDLSLTTNGSLLSEMASPLKKAGLDRLNISIDSLDALRFKEVTSAKVLEKVLDAFSLCIRLGFFVKANMVVLKGVSEEEILELANMAYHNACEVRFLEFMPLCGSKWPSDLFIPIDKIRNMVRERFKLKEITFRDGRAAQTFEIQGGKGRVGFIASVTEPFCGQCSRIRLTADGMIRPCLFSHDGVWVKDLLKKNVPDEEIMQAIRRVVQIKPEGSPFIKEPFQEPRAFATTENSTPYIRMIGG